jgi:hypothetical protein
MTRARLPNRRFAETFEFSIGGLHYTCTVGRFANGAIAELFLTNHTSNSAADTAARDAAIAFSFAVQHGADAHAIRRALCRDSRGQASAALGCRCSIKSPPLSVYGPRRSEARDARPERCPTASINEDTSAAGFGGGIGSS